MANEREEFEPPSEALSSLFAEERKAPLPKGSEERVLAGVLERLSLTALSPGSQATETAAQPASETAAGEALALGTSKGTALAALALSALVGAAVGIAIDRQLRDSPERQVSQVALPVLAVQDAGSELSIAPSFEPDDAGVLDASAPPSRARPTPTARSAVARDENLIIDRGRAALRRGLYDEALLALMEHERKHPQGQLVEERDVLVIEAYLARGDVTLARRRIDAYRRTHSQGYLESRVDRAEAALRPQ